MGVLRRDLTLVTWSSWLVEKRSSRHCKMKDWIFCKVPWWKGRRRVKSSTPRESMSSDSRKLKIRKEQLKSRESESRCSEKCSKPEKELTRKDRSEILSKSTRTSDLWCTLLSPEMACLWTNLLPSMKSSLTPCFRITVFQNFNKDFGIGDQDDKDFEERLSKAYKRRKKWARKKVLGLY